jgi:uncharacterized membrane-anchored protein YhcB (DUF1043 family)
MRRFTYVVISCAMLVTGVALGKLPAPSPEEQAAAAAKKAKEQEQLEKEKAALERAQDRVVQRYRQEKGGTGQSASSGRVSDQNMPKTTSELPRGVGPTRDRPQSAEAHSAPAK